MPKPESWDPFLIAAAALAGALCLGGLGGRDLWQDEAETALLGRNILARGLPYAFDGINVVSAEAGKEYGPDFLWRWSPWLQFYMAAAGLAIGGTSTSAARLPFALVGLACIPLLYAVSRRYFGSLWIARVSAFVLALSVPFLLHSRQARWHSPACLFALSSLWFLAGLERGRRFSAAGLVLSGALLFYTNYFTAIAFLSAILCAALIIYQDASFRRKLLLSGLACAVLCVPGLILHQVLDKPAGFKPEIMVGHFMFYMGSLCTFILPLPVIALMIRLSQTVSPQDVQAREFGKNIRFLLLLSLLYILVLSLGPWRFFRYLAPLFGVAALMTAAAVVWVYERHKVLGSVMGALLLFTNALHMIPLELMRASGTLSGDGFSTWSPLRFPFFGFLHELAYPFSHCDRLVADHLRVHAAREDSVLATYGDLPLQFYTGLKVKGGFQGRKMPREPDWIVVHPYIVSRQPGKDYDVLRFIKEKIDLRRYKAVPLPCRDLMLGHCPEPAAHVFSEPTNRPPATLLRKLPLH